MSIKIGNTSIKEIYIGSTKMAEGYVGSTKFLTQSGPSPSHDPVVDTFYFLTYFYKNGDGTIRTYQNGTRVDVTPTCDMTLYKNKTETFGTGEFNYASSTSRSGNGYTTTYDLSADQRNYWKTGAVQYEYVFNYTAWANSGTIIPLQTFMGMHKLDWQNSRFEFLNLTRGEMRYASSSMSARDSKWNTFRNYEWNSFQSSSSKWTAGTYHLVCTLDIVNKKTLFWINGILQGVVYWTNDYINNYKLPELNGTVTASLNTANLASTVWLTQFGIRPAVWTAEQNYTPISKPYLSVSEYY